jgi:hypothetical protein
VAVDVGEPQLRAGMGAFFAVGYPSPLANRIGPSMPVISATQAPDWTWALGAEGRRLGRRRDLVGSVLDLPDDG